MYENFFQFFKSACYKYNQNNNYLKMLPLTKEELTLHQDVTNCSICGKRMLKMFDNSTNYYKNGDNCYSSNKYSGAAHSICI